jgi:hypothetical protein
MRILRVLSLIVEEVSLLVLTASEFAKDLLSLATRFALLSADEEVGCLVKWSLFGKENINFLIPSLFQIQIKLRVKNVEASFLSDQLKLQHANLKGNWLHQKVLCSHIVHKHVYVLDEGLLLPHCQWETWDSKILNIFI